MTLQDATSGEGAAIIRSPMVAVNQNNVVPLRA
jgi:hypothetical protein